MIDILFLAHGRPEFTLASLAALRANTNWARVRRVVIYSDGWDAPDPIALAKLGEAKVVYREMRLGGPVAVMTHYLQQGAADTFAKIDNDVIVSPGWLDQCLEVMDENPALDILGIEPPSTTVRIGPFSSVAEARGFALTQAIGGIGLMRSPAFAGRPIPKHPDIRGGFTDWQLAHPEIDKGWLAPPLDLFLLDRLPFEPWLSLSKRYEVEGQQRPWKKYTAEDAHLWSWWTARGVAA